MTASIWSPNSVTTSPSSLLTFIRSEAGAVSRTAQDKFNYLLSVEDFGALNDDGTDDTAKFQAAYDAAGPGDRIIVEGNGVFTLSAPLSPSTKNVLWEVYGATQIGGTPLPVPGLLESYFQNRKLFRKIYTDGNDDAMVECQRVTNHTNGTAGNAANALKVYTKVNPGPVNFEWAFLSVLDNYATGSGENVAGYLQAKKYSTGATWASVIEARDMTNGAAGNQLVGVELDIFANGNDTNSNRVGIDIVTGKGVAGGATSQSQYAIRIGAQNQDSSQGTFVFGIRLNEICSQSAISINTAGTFGINLGTNAALTTGIDLSSGNITSTTAVRLKRGNRIAFEPTDALTQSVDLANPIFKFNNGTNAGASVEVSAAAGSSYFLIDGTRVVQARKTGWTQATGTATRTTFVTSTVTLPVLAEHVKALIDDLYNASIGA